MSSVLRGPPRPGLSLFHPVHGRPGSGSCPVVPVPGCPFPTMKSPSGGGGFGRGWSGSTVTTGLVLIVPSTLPFSDLQSPRTGTSTDRPPSLFSQARAKFTCSHSQLHLSRGKVRSHRHLVAALG